jgi:hypothetical protein
MICLALSVEVSPPNFLFFLAFARTHEYLYINLGPIIIYRARIFVVYLLINAHLD